MEAHLFNAISLLALLPYYLPKVCNTIEFVVLFPMWTSIYIAEWEPLDESFQKLSNTKIKDEAIALLILRYEIWRLHYHLLKKL